MKILLLAECNSVHTIKWAIYLSREGLEVLVFSLSVLKVDAYENTDVKIIDFRVNDCQKNIFQKINYLKALPYLKRIIQKEQPNIVHAHYATSYGLLGALSGFKPFIISVWGSDVFEFPAKSLIHKSILKYNLSKADKILSTSNVMAVEANKYTGEQIEITPFGIDIDVFKKIRFDGLFDGKDIVIGTIKTLEEKYGISYLIKAFKILIEKYPEYPLKLLVVGGGSLELKLKKMVSDFKLSDKVVFTGSIPFTDIPKYHNMIDVFVALSLEESFGVAVIEASSCQVPVVVSNIGGLPEVVENGVTGIIIPSKNPIKAAEAIEKLVVNPELRINMGNEGRERVKRLYNWKDNVEQMVNIYKKIVI